MTDYPFPGPWVDPEALDPTPWSNQDGIIKFIEFPVRIAEMSQRAFHLHWQRHHSPHVMNVTSFSRFIRKYNTGHVYPRKVEGLPAHYRQTTPFEGAAEVWINRLSEVGTWLSHPLYAQLIQPDETRFIRQDGSVEVVLVKEERLYEPDPDLCETGLTKLHLLMKRRPGLARPAFHEGLSALGGHLLAQASLRSRLRKLVISHRLADPLPEGVPMADIDAVLELWFNDRQEIERFYADPAYTDAVGAREKPLVGDSGIRALAVRMHVVHDEMSFQPSTTQPMLYRWEE